MRLWNTLAILGLAFGLGGVGWGYARQRNYSAIPVTK